MTISPKEEQILMQADLIRKRGDKKYLKQAKHIWKKILSGEEIFLKNIITDGFINTARIFTKNSKRTCFYHSCTRLKDEQIDYASHNIFGDSGMMKSAVEITKKEYYGRQKSKNT